MLSPEAQANESKYGLEQELIYLNPDELGRTLNVYANSTNIDTEKVSLILEIAIQQIEALTTLVETNDSYYLARNNPHITRTGYYAVATEAVSILELCVDGANIDCFNALSTGIR